MFNLDRWRMQQLSVTTWMDGEYWCAKSAVDPIVYRSRKSRQKAIAYALRALADQYEAMETTTLVDAEPTNWEL